MHDFHQDLSQQRTRDRRCIVICAAAVSVLLVAACVYLVVSGLHAGSWLRAGKIDTIIRGVEDVNAYSGRVQAMVDGKARGTNTLDGLTNEQLRSKAQQIAAGIKNAGTVAAYREKYAAEAIAARQEMLLRRRHSTGTIPREATVDRVYARPVGAIEMKKVAEDLEQLARSLP